MKILDIIEHDFLDKHTLGPAELAEKYGVPINHVISRMNDGIKIEMEHTTNPRIAREIALDHLGERLDYYNVLDKAEHDPEIDEVYPGQSSGRLKNYVHRKYGGDITCGKAVKVKNSNASKAIKNRASWYQSLHCK